MKFTLNWLKDHLETSASLTEIADKLTAIGLEVESVTDRAEALKDFIVAEILEAAPHPNAQKLQVCKVSDGKETRQIVCGAANARTGLKVVLAREGAFIPGSGITIKKTKIRDVESNGMLCSAEELQLAESSEGIIELPKDAKPGEPAAPALGGGDPAIEIAVTPNRADALGVYGIARDLAAAGIGTLKKLEIPALNPKAQSPIPVTLQTPGCPYFIGCHIKGVKNGPSPAWLQERLTAIGLRPISALVDITNYMTYTFGRPLHVFDAAKLKGGITVRNAKDGEKLSALDGKEYTLKNGMTVIADDAQALAIGGIIGGIESGCTETTTDVFLEAAYFDPVNIAQTGRALEILSDARYRFERGVDPEFVETGALIAIGLITKICGGEAGALAKAGAAPAWQREISFNPALVKTLGGVELSEKECNRILLALGFSGSNLYEPPSWRRDVEGAADLVEEILRIHGYDHIPPTPLPQIPSMGKSTLTPAQARIALARRALATRGLLEVCSWSFLPEAQARMFGGGDAKLKLVNPISADLDTMRPSLLPNLLTAAMNNHNRSLDDLYFFEVGVQFHGTAPNEQKNVAAGLRAGAGSEPRYDGALFKQEALAAAVFEAKADALALLEQLNINTDGLTITANTPGWYHPGRSGALTLGGKVVLGYFGEIHPAILQAFDLAEIPVCGFEIFLDAIPLPRAKGKAKPMLKASAFQPVQRDFAFLVDERVTAENIIRALVSANKELVTKVRIFDVYSGKGVEAGKKSVAVQVTLQAQDRTLSDAEITTVSQSLVTAAMKEFSGVLRQ